MGATEEPSRLVHQFVAAAASENPTADIALRLALLLDLRDLPLLEFVEVLGPTLTSDDVGLRVVAVRCLAETLARLLAAVISKQDVSVLVQFLTAKLEDEKLSAYTLNALASLVRVCTFVPSLKGDLDALLARLCSSYDPRKHLARVRYEAFVLLDAVMEKHNDALAALPTLADAYITAFIHVASGEKDPRNLLLSFLLNRRINGTVAFDARSANEAHNYFLGKLFDLCFCYFPISFTTPENDPYKITADDLRTLLRLAIAAQLQFAQDVFPELFEKLTSTNPAVRNDVLLCLLLCVQNYPAPVLEQYWHLIWNALHFEILHNDVLAFRGDADCFVSADCDALDDTDETKTSMLTVQALSVLVARLDACGALPAVVDAVLDGLSPHYKLLGGKTAKPAVFLLCAMGASSERLYNAAVDRLFAFDTWGHYVRSDAPANSETEVDVLLTTSKQKDLIDSLGYVITAQKQLGVPSSFARFKDHVLVFMGQLLQTSSSVERLLQCKIVLQLVNLVRIDAFLSAEDVRLVLTWLSEALNALVTRVASSDAFVREITRGLTRIMAAATEAPPMHTDAVVAIVLPPLLDQLPNPAALDVIGQICCNYQFVEVLSIRYLGKLAQNLCDQVLFVRLVENLTRCFQQVQEQQPFLASGWYRKFVTRFVSTVCVRFPADVVVMQLAGRLLGLVVRYCERLRHAGILADMAGLFLDGAAVAGFPHDLLLDGASPHVSLFKHVVANIDRRCTLAQPHEHITRLIALLPHVSDTLVKMEYLQLVALFINKFSVSCDAYISRAVDELFSADCADTRSFETAVWVAKGLIVRADPVGLEYTSRLVAELSSSDNATQNHMVPRAFAVLMGDLEIFASAGKLRIISDVVHLNVRPLYKQQVFERLAPVLIGKYEQETRVLVAEDRKELYLSTLAILIRNVSLQVIRPHLGAVLPLVLSGLYLYNSSIVEASLQTLDVAIVQTPELLLDDLPSVVKQLARLATCKILVGATRLNNETVRLASLECLLRVVQGSDAKMRRILRELIQGLAPGLDDKRRAVRNKTTEVCQALHEMR